MKKSKPKANSNLGNRPSTLHVVANPQATTKKFKNPMISFAYCGQIPRNQIIIYNDQTVPFWSSNLLTVIKIPHGDI